MSERTLDYVVVTPVRNDEANLRRLAQSLTAQSVRPTRWIIADNGSTDGTPTAAEELTREHPWARALSVPTDDGMMRGAPIVRAFHAAVASLDFEPDVVVKLDADVTIETDYFARLMDAFDADPHLGIAGGACYEQRSDGTWRQRHSTGIGVWGANRAYRWACLQELLPLEERMGWDTLDLVKAAVTGWEGMTFDGLPFRHHRKEGERDGGRARAWATQGAAAHYMGYRPSYLLLRTAYRVAAEPAAVALLWGYLRAAIRRDATCMDERLRDYVRAQQRLRNVRGRASEALRPRVILDEPREPDERELPLQRAHL